MNFLSKVLYATLGVFVGVLMSFSGLKSSFEGREDFLIEETAFIHCYYFLTLTTMNPGSMGTIACTEYAKEFSNNFKDIKSQGE